MSLVDKDSVQQIVFPGTGNVVSFPNATFTVPTSGGGGFTPPTGTGFVTVTAGALDAASLAFPLSIAKGGTGVASLPGSDGQLFYRSSGALGATGNVTYNGTGLVVTSSGFVSHGTTPAASGDLRFGRAATAKGRNNGDSADLVLFSMSTSDQLYIGSDTAGANRYSSLRIGATILEMTPGGSFGGQWDSTGLEVNGALKVNGPIQGDSGFSGPFQLGVAIITQNSNTDITLTAAQYACGIIRVIGTPTGSFNVIGPAGSAGPFFIDNRTTNAFNFKKSGGAGVSISSLVKKPVYYDGSDYAALT